MNNWRLLLLAVVAVLQPIDSFTERNLIDGREECCDHRSNSIVQDTRLYGNYHKSNTEEHLNTREDIRENRRYDARNGPITRSRERLVVERADRRISLEPARLHDVTRLSEQERRQRISVDSSYFRLTRDNQNRKFQERSARDASNNYERDTLDPRGVVGVSRDDARTVRSRDTRRVHNSENIRRVSTNRETIDILNRENNDAAHEIRRYSRTNAVQSVARSQLDNNRERRPLERRIDESRRSHSLESRKNSVKGQMGLELRIDSREDRRNNFHAISERVDERRFLDQNRESNNRIITIRRLPTERMYVDRMRESRDTTERTELNIKDTRNRNNERIDERRQQRDENRISDERTSTVRRSRISPSDERRPALAQETEFINNNIRSVRFVRSSEKMNERRDADRDMIRASRHNTNERPKDSRLSRILEANDRDARLVRIEDSRREERHQLKTRSLDRVSVLRASRDVRSMKYEQSSRITARLPEKNIREDTARTRYSGDIRSVERLDERRQQRDESRLSTPRTELRIRESRNEAERRQQGNISRRVVDARYERVSMERGDIRENERIDTIRRDREVRIRASGEQTLIRIVPETESRQDQDISMTFRFAERAPSAKQNFRVRDVRGERTEAHRDFRDGHKQSSERTVVIERLTRVISAPQRRYDTRITSQVTETSARLQRTTKLDNIRDERRVVRERDENEEFRGRVFMNRVIKERIEVQGSEAQETRDSRADARNESTRNRRNVPMNFEGLRQKERRSARDNVASRLTERRSRELAARSFKPNVRAERLSKNREEMKSNEREVRDIRAIESRMTEREVQTNRLNSATDRMDRPAKRESGLRIQARPLALDKNTRANTRHDVADSRFRSFESKLFYINPVEETSEKTNAMNWQMIFYTLQGAYLCGILMQILTEKSMGKSRNFTWWASSAKELVKVD